MAGAVPGIWNQLSHAHTAAAEGPAKAVSYSENSSSNSASVSANDFLTLLVTEMKNQDPTANTDPNEYINQLVQVNSLEQLISINQTLTADSVAVGSNSSAPAAGARMKTTGARTPRAIESGTLNQFRTSSEVREVPGNLTIPAGSPAATRIAQALAR
jgi:flagellar hook assembly protein FlgD